MMWSIDLVTSFCLVKVILAGMYAWSYDLTS